MSVEEGLLLACSGFLLAVLWMDLIFDTQVRLRGERSARAGARIHYYRRATTTSRPMSRLIAVVMVILLGALVFRGVRGHDPVWLPRVGSARRRAHSAGPGSDGAQRGSTRQSVGRSCRTITPRAVGLPRPSRVCRVRVRVSHRATDSRRGGLNGLQPSRTRLTIARIWPATNCGWYSMMLWPLSVVVIFTVPSASASRVLARCICSSV